MAAAPIVGLPPLPAPGEPGPFALADPDHVRYVTAAAGYDDIHVKGRTSIARIPASDLAKTAARVVEVGPLALLLRGAPTATRSEVVAAVASALGEHVEEGWLEVACEPGSSQRRLDRHHHEHLGIGHSPNAEAMAELRRQNRVYSRPPFGWDATADGHIAPNETEQAALARLTELQEQGWSLRDLANWPDAEGCKPKRRSLTGDDHPRGEAAIRFGH